MNEDSGLRNRARHSPERLLRLAATAATLGLAAAVFAAGSDPMQELADQPLASATAAFTHPGPQVLYAAP